MSSKIAITTLLAVAFLCGSATAANAAVPSRIVFPVVAKTTYSDDFGTPRSGGRTHQGNDVFAERKARLVAVEPGTVMKWTSSANAGCMVYLYGASGTVYHYVHLNNDRTSANDTSWNRCTNGVAYAPGLESGDAVRAGEFLGYLGDSGNADGGSPHLHFELHPAGGGAVSPYDWLRGARHLLFQRPPDVETSLRLRLNGVFAWADSDSLRVSYVNRVAISNGWSARPHRGVTLAVTNATKVYRATADGRDATALSSLTAGEQVGVETANFQPTLRAQRARPHVIAAASAYARAE